MHRTGVPAGAAAAVGGQRHHHPVELAAQLLKLIVAEFPDRDVHGVGDAAYHGKPLQVPGATCTTDYRPTPACSTPRHRGPAAAAVRR